jgi:hypothetical protein
MVSNSETGHAMNVANYDELILRASGLGSSYDPKQVIITVPAMQAKSVDARAAIDRVRAALPVWSTAVAEREKAFEALSGIATRVINALVASGVDPKIVANARTIVRKIHGVRSTRKLTPEEKQAMKDNGKEVNEISTSQMSYDSRIENFNALVFMIAAIAEYVPNEPALKKEGLKAYLEDLRKKNTAVIAAADPLNNARILRNQVLYNDKTGLVATALMAKAYIKSVFGATDPTFKAISKLAFKKVEI